MQHEEEGLILWASLNELNAEVTGDVGAVASDIEFVPRHQKDGVPILALARQNDPSVKAGRITAKMPFADHSGMVTARLEVLGDVVTRSIEPIEDGHTIEMGILTSDEGGAAGGADRIGDKRVQKSRSTGSDTVNIGSDINL